MAQTQVNISATSGNISSASTDAAIQSKLDSLTLGAPANAGPRKFLTEEENRTFVKMPLTLLNGFKADDAAIYVSPTLVVIGILGLVDTTPGAGQQKIADTPNGIKVGTSPLCQTGSTSLSGYVAGYASDTEIFANTNVSQATVKMDISGTFARLN